MKWPLTFCLTFDDGFKVHHDVAASIVEAHGWRGIFNVPTEFMDSNHVPLTPDQAWDCRLSGNEDNFMTWDDVRDLVKRGHEVYPHTLGHIDLLKLEQEGKIDELNRQISESKRQFVEQLGYAPKFFCSPHNSWSPGIVRAVRANGMELFNCCRRNFPTCPGHESMTLTDFVKSEWRRGTRHVDIMMHGIVRAKGGWEPFEDATHFDRFCDELKGLEQAGIVKVVSYASSHVKPGPFVRERCFIQRVLNKLKRVCFVS